MARKKLILFPCNGNAMEALDCVDADAYDVLGFVDDDASKKPDGFAVFTRAIISKYAEISVLAVPGSPDSYKQRAQAIASLKLPAERFATIIHPKANVGHNATVGYNTLIMAGVVLTSNAAVGNHVCILPNSVVHHHSRIGHFTLIGSNVVIAGGCDIGENGYIGSGSNVKNGVRIGPFALVGLGSNILHHVEAHAKMVGNPARNIHLQLT